MKGRYATILIILLTFLASSSCDFELKTDNGTPLHPAHATIIDHTTRDITRIPAEWITAAKNTLHIAYQNTSHGSQIVSGMDTLASYPPFGTLYQRSENGAVGLDLDSYDPIMPGYNDLSNGDSADAQGNTPWANATRTYLNNAANYQINVVMYSWCNINDHDINRYITNMERLISEYGAGGTNPRAAQHPVEFVFMTGRSSSSQNNTGFIAQAAARIRAHCEENNRWCIDYYDMEAHDVTGNFYGHLNINDNLNYTGGNWATEYLDANPTSLLYTLTMGNGGSFNGCTSCAHSDTPRSATFNCVLKGMAAWHLFARIAGWDGQ